MPETAATATTGRERVRAAMLCRETDRTPWVPFVGSHGGRLIGVDAATYLQSADLMAQGLARAVEMYEPDGLPVMFDLQVEAEALGCRLKWAADNPPAVVSHPLAEGVRLEDLRVPDENEGRIPLALETARRARAAHPDLALYGLVTGPFTLALHLLGTDIFMQMFDDPEAVDDLLAFASRVSSAMAERYVAAGCDVVALVDPMTSQIGPEQFVRFVTPAAAPVFERVRERGALSSFFVCGHAQQNVAAMCDSGPDNLSVDENIGLEYVREVCLPRGVSFGGNLQLTSVLLLGKPLDAERNALQCLDVAGPKGFLLAPGCDLPFDTPVENLQAAGLVARDPYRRDVVRTLVSEEAPSDLLDMHEYGQTDRVIVDVVTLDSEACAPCQYMVESVQKAVPEFEGIVEWREHKIKQPEALVFMTSLMVKNIPTICIDGRITFVSRIPKREELIAAIRQRIYEKLRMRIRRRRAAIYVLGAEGEQTEALRARVQRAVVELGTDVLVETVSDEPTMLAYGVDPSLTPACVLARYQIKSTRKIPETAVVKEWIKDLE